MSIDSDSEENFEVGEEVEPKGFEISGEWVWRVEWGRFGFPQPWRVVRNNEGMVVKIEYNMRILTDTFTEYINNTLPIYLLRLNDMKLISRSKIIRSLRFYIRSLAECELFLRAEDIVDLPSKALRYAVLSHRWDHRGELDFIDVQDMAKLDMTGAEGSSMLGKLVSQLERLPRKLGGKYSRCATSLKKLVKFCNLAQQQNCQYAWIDTCCIDKRSSSELEESIRSMFKWYRNSTICIVHLSSTTSSSNLSSDPWFTRGWTLQELLAPKRIKFFDSFWQPIQSLFNDKHFRDDGRGHGHGHNLNWLLEDISDITSIPIEHLQNFTPGTRSIRQTMEWMSNRQTTRIEDMAYCLLGIFDVNLSISYGEGAKAFYRLQVELLETSNDRGIFLWSGTPSPWNSMLAASPKGFKSRELPYPIAAHLGSSQLDPTSAMTNHGLRIPLSVYDVRRQGEHSLPYFCLAIDRSDLVPIELPVNNPANLKTFKCAILGKSLLHDKPRESARGGIDMDEDDDIEEVEDAEDGGEFFCIFLRRIPRTSPPQYKRLSGSAIRVKIPKEAFKPAQVVFIVADNHPEGNRL